MGSVWGGFRVPFVEWFGFHSLMYDPPLPPYSGGAIFGLLFVKRVVDRFNVHIFSYLLIFYSIFLEGVCLICALVMFRWKVHGAVIRAKLEPCLGFFHSEQFGKPSLVCDFMELYRYLVDDFVIQFCQGLSKKDFVVKGERTTRKRWGKREYLNGARTRELEIGLDELFQRWVEIPRIRYGSRQTLETLINEETLLLAKYLRNEKTDWTPRIATVH